MLNELILRKVLILILIVFFVFEISAQWTQVSSGTTQNIYDLHFPTDSIGYAVGYSGTVLKSTDAGDSWIEMNKNIEEAGKMLQKAVNQRPDSGYIIDSLGWAYFKLGRYDEALTQLELAAELNPNDPVINDHLGDVYWMVNKHLQARFQWEKALLFDPQEDLIPILEHKLLFGLES